MKSRRALAVIAAVVAIGFFIAAVAAWTPVTVVKNRQLTDLLRAAIDLKIDQSRSEFQIALLVLGALWGLMIAKRDEVKIVLSDMPEIVMFWCASALLLASTVFHVMYVENIAYIFALAGSIDGGKSVPDVFESGINNPYKFQFWALLAGLVVGLMTLLSAHRLKAKGVNQ
jgi:hypothetical protein